MEEVEAMERGTALAGWMGSKRIAVFTSLLALVGLAGEAGYCWVRPAASFDAMAYAAIAEGGASNFRTVGAECAAQVPGKRSACAETMSLEMFQQVAAYTDAEFAESLRFYTVKPLYCELAKVLHRWGGLGAFVGLRVISVGSFVAIGVVTWVWLREHLPVAVAPIAAFWMTAAGPVVGLGKQLGPDGLSTALLLLGVYVLLYRRAKWLGTVALALALLARPDVVLFIGCFAGAWVLRWQHESRRRWMLLAVVVAGCAAVSFVLGKATGALPWATLFRRSFFELVPPERYMSVHVTVREYLRVLADNGVRTVMFCLPVALLLATLAVMAARRGSALRALVLASVVAVGLRVLVQPGVEERYYVWFYLVCAISAACVLAERAEFHKEFEQVA